MSERPLLSPVDLSRELGVAPRTLEAWRARGEGPPFVRLGPRRIAYPRAALLAWLASRQGAAPGRAA